MKILFYGYIPRDVEYYNDWSHKTTADIFSEIVARLKSLYKVGYRTYLFNGNSFFDHLSFAAGHYLKHKCGYDVELILYYDGKHTDDQKRLNVYMSKGFADKVVKGRAVFRDADMLFSASTFNGIFYSDDIPLESLGINESEVSICRNIQKSKLPATFIPIS